MWYKQHYILTIIAVKILCTGVSVNVAVHMRFMNHQASESDLSTQYGSFDQSVHTPCTPGFTSNR